jgi:hypothetical protein
MDGMGALNAPMRKSATHHLAHEFLPPASGIHAGERGRESIQRRQGILEEACGEFHRLVFDG